MSDFYPNLRERLESRFYKGCTGSEVNSSYFLLDCISVTLANYIHSPNQINGAISDILCYGSFSSYELQKLSKLIVYCDEPIIKKYFEKLYGDTSSAVQNIISDQITRNPSYPSYEFEKTFRTIVCYTSISDAVRNTVIRLMYNYEEYRFFTFLDSIKRTRYGYIDIPSGSIWNFNSMTSGCVFRLLSEYRLHRDNLQNYDKPLYSLFVDRNKSYFNELSEEDQTYIRLKLL